MGHNFDHGYSVHHWVHCSLVYVLANIRMYAHVCIAHPDPKASEQEEQKKVTYRPVVSSTPLKIETHSSCSVRQAFCVPKRPELSDAADLYLPPWHRMVDPRLCPPAATMRPPLVRECNRFPCPATWSESGWSECSSTNACPASSRKGIQRLLYACRPPDGEIFYDCGLDPSVAAPVKRHCEVDNDGCPARDECDGKGIYLNLLHILINS